MHMHECSFVFVFFSLPGALSTPLRPAQASGVGPTKTSHEESGERIDIISFDAASRENSPFLLGRAEDAFSVLFVVLSRVWAFQDLFRRTKRCRNAEIGDALAPESEQTRVACVVSRILWGLRETPKVVKVFAEAACAAERATFPDSPRSAPNVSNETAAADGDGITKLFDGVFASENVENNAPLRSRRDPAFPKTTETPTGTMRTCK
ncbi:hypothetical protein L596_011617 [Steinernema carpocapsae]|uniref:Uncharacterized protein n=1 Tax=Steinernema carpocapsae TaxID=34508 RepID=A0A4U5NV90_STECR|nr:hypothetical protein L596_011617 [Steinernema carpocapsae]